VCTLKDLVTYYILFFIDIASRSIHIAGITPHPHNPWMTQIARNITDVNDGFLRGKRYLILDRDTKYSEEFGNIPAPRGRPTPTITPPLDARRSCFWIIRGHA